LGETGVNGKASLGVNDKTSTGIAKL